MGAVSAVFYFLSHHPFLALPLYPVVALAIGAALARLTRWRGWMFLGVPGLIAAAVSPFFGSAVNAIFLNAVGTTGSAVIVHSEETSSTLNDNNIWYYQAVVRTADGRNVETDFDTMTAALYPWRNEIQIPPEGERFVVKYVPEFPQAPDRAGQGAGRDSSGETGGGARRSEIPRRPEAGAPWVHRPPRDGRRSGTAGDLSRAAGGFGCGIDDQAAGLELCC
jgi:hypothetical protein